MEEICYWLFCFTPIIESSNERIFGFSEYLTAVALLALLYTITDTRYKFRIAITPGYLHTTSYYLLATIGFQSLLSEVWIAEGWWVPVTKGLTYSIWQMIFGMLFLGTFLTWMYYAFIRPPVFGKRNARRYARELYKYVLKGSDDELKVIADELSRSAHSLIELTRNIDRHNNTKRLNHSKRIANAKDYAHDILLLIGSRRLCMHIVATSPVTALAFFEEMTTRNKFNIPIGQFAKNISSEAIAQKDSFLYGESEGYTSGLLGYLKPVSTAIYGNFDLVEALAVNHISPLSINFKERWKWDSEQWEAYCRATLLTLKDYLVKKSSPYSAYSIFNALSDMEDAMLDIHTLNGLNSTYDTEISEKLSTIVHFVKDAIELINTQTTTEVPLRTVRKNTHNKNIYDEFASLIFEICFNAATINSPQDTCWNIHYNVVWGRLFTTNTGKAWKIVHHKVRRLFYDEIVRLEKFPNYKSSRILGFCLNILIDESKPTSDFERPQYPLAKAVQSWTSQHYLQLRKDNIEVADSVLVGSISFDNIGKQLVKTYIKGLNKIAPQTHLKLRNIKTTRKTRSTLK
jgi:hypothetical protein